MILRDQLIAIGHYNKPHGIAGEISATIDVDIDVLRAVSCLISDIDGIYVPFFLNACRPKTAETVLLMIDGIDSDREAASLANKDIFVLKTDYSQHSDDDGADGYPLDYFVGYSLAETSGHVLGTIVDVDEQTENAIFIVDHHGREIMVPANDDLIVEFDTNKKLMVMDLPQGLIDLNNN